MAAMYLSHYFDRIISGLELRIPQRIAATFDSDCQFCPSPGISGLEAGCCACHSFPMNETFSAVENKRDVFS